jgi:hypothetical protein
MCDLCVNDQRILNLECYTDIELYPAGAGPNTVRVHYGADYSVDLNGAEAEAVRNWARTGTLRAYPDRIESGVTAAFQPARSMTSAA